MNWIIIAYAIATPFAIWIELATERGDCVEERLRLKASKNLKGVAWMFDSGFSAWHMLWAIASGPFVIGFLAVAVVAIVPVAFVAEFVFGVDLLKDGEEASAAPDDGDLAR